MIADRTSSNKAVAVDIGCGHGFGVYRLLRNYHVIGVDINYKNLQIARKRFGVIVCTMDAEKLAIKNDSVQYIEMSDVVEHVGDAPLCLAEGARVLRAGGWATISVPTARSERLLLRLRPSYSDEIGHKNIFEEKQIKHLITTSQLKIKKIVKKDFLVIVEMIAAFLVSAKKRDTDQTSMYSWREHKILFLLHIVIIHFDKIIWDTPIWWSPFVIITIPLGFIINVVGNKIIPKSVTFYAIKHNEPDL